MMKKNLAILIILMLLSTSISYGDSVSPYRNGYIEGYFLKTDNNNIYIEEYDGTLHNIPIGNGANFSIDDRPVSISDFKVGMEVYAQINARKIFLMESFSVDSPGYITEGSKVRSGIVKKIDRDQVIIKLPTGKEETYFTSAAIITTKKKSSVPLSTLYEGDRVKLYFDDINSSFINRLEIEGDSILVKDLYKGNLSISDKLEDIITLENVEVFRNGKWQDLNNGIKMPYNSELPLYIGGQKISYKNLQYYKGKTVYMAVKDFFGQEKIEKMVIKSQYETTYSDKIADVNWYTSQFELGNKKNISFHDGTMVIKNGRLVDTYAITPKSDGFIVADGIGANATADVVYIYNEDINNSSIGQNQIYSGRINTILENRLEIKDFFLLNQNDWESFRDEKELYYDNDTFIYDLEENKHISSEAFLSRKYAIDEDARKNNRDRDRDWYGYIYTDGDRISAIYVQKSMDSLLRQRTTIGVAENNAYEDNLTGWTVALRDAKDWSSRNSEWMSKSASLNIRIKDSMIIKDGKRISAGDIKSGDRLYIVRDDLVGKIIIVK